MKERQIPFMGEMVRAVLDDRKGQTRRVLHQAVGPSLSVDYEDETGEAVLSWLRGDGPGHDVQEQIKRVRSPYGVPGDRLWVREAWRVSKKHDAIAPRELRARSMTVMYEAGGYSNNDEEGWRTVDGPPMAPDWRGKYRPAMFMPRWASRITLEVTGVRVERLQDINADDVRAEGLEYREDNIGGRICRRWRSYGTPDGWFPEGRDIAPIHSFQSLWDGLNSERGFGWHANPWVWVVDFKRIEA